MATFRVPYPKEPERRRALFEKALARLGAYGSCEGTPDEGTFRAKTPVGGLAGSYRSEPESEEVEFTIARKPLLVPLAMIESQARKFIETA